jgi:hypothetical protein
MKTVKLMLLVLVLLTVALNGPIASGAASRKHRPAASVPLIQEITPGIVEYKRGASGSGRHTRKSGLVRSPYSHAMRYTDASGGDYVGQTEGISRWPDGHTIKVYVAPGRANAAAMIANCFSQWSRATGGRVNYRLVGNSGDADYVVSWTSHQREGYDGTEAGLTTTDTFVDPDSEQEFIDHAQTRILTRFDGRALTDGEVAETCLHEIGHGLGIEGHSSNPSDIMYYAVSARQSGHLTNRDCNTISRLYSY